jgi:hypothetical protein
MKRRTVPSVRETRVSSRTDGTWPLERVPIALPTRARRSSPTGNERPEMNSSDRAETPADATKDAEWFYTQKGDTFGPVSALDLRAAAHLGFFGPDDMVRRKDRKRWIVAKSIRGLFKDNG